MARPRAAVIEPPPTGTLDAVVRRPARDPSIDGLAATKQPLPTGAGWSSRRQALAAVAGFAALLAGSWIAAFRIGAAGRFDAKALLAFMVLRHPGLLTDARAAVSFVTPVSVIVVTAMVVVCAALLRGGRSAIAALVTVAGANGSAVVLKVLMPAHGTTLINLISIDGRTFPSGHATAAMSVVLAALLALPGRSRAAVGTIGTGYVIVLGYSMAMLGMHYPSDVIGGDLLAGLWAALGAAALWPASEPRHDRIPRRAASGSQSLGVPMAWMSCFGVVLAAIGILRAPGPNSPVVVSSAAVALVIVAVLTVVVLDKLTCTR